MASCPLTWNQFLKMVAARRPAPAREDHGDAGTAHPEAYYLRLAAARETRHPHPERAGSGHRPGSAKESTAAQASPSALTAQQMTRFLQVYTSEEFRERRRVLITAIAEWSNLPGVWPRCPPYAPTARTAS
jgi:hypothetical protein